MGRGRSTRESSSERRWMILGSRLVSHLSVLIDSPERGHRFDRARWGTCLARPDGPKPLSVGRAVGARDCADGRSIRPGCAGIGDGGIALRREPQSPMSRIRAVSRNAAGREKPTGWRSAPPSGPWCDRRRTATRGVASSRPCGSTERSCAAVMDRRQGSELRPSRRTQFRARRADAGVVSSKNSRSTPLGG
jgi:hypothetical protein